MEITEGYIILNIFPLHSFIYQLISLSNTVRAFHFIRKKKRDKQLQHLFENSKPHVL